MKVSAQRQNSKRGGALIEMLIASFMLVIVIIGLIGILARQGQSAVWQLGERRALFILDGELEHLYAMPGDEVKTLADGFFTPSLKVPAPLEKVKWSRTIKRNEKSFLEVELKADFSATSAMHRPPLVIRGRLYVD